MAFCDAFIFGRLGKIALQDVAKHAYNNLFSRAVAPTALDYTRSLRSRIAADGHIGLGAISVDSTGKVLACFGMCLIQEQLALFHNAGQQTILGEFETLTVALSLLVWHDLLGSVQLFVYIDNEGSEFSLVKCYSTSRAIAAVCTLMASTLDVHFVLPWFVRAPSISYIADSPSRQLEHPLLVKDTMAPPEDIGRSFEESFPFF